MEKVSELLLRNVDRLRGEEILLVNPPRDSCFRTLESGGRKVRLFTQDFGDYQWLLDCGAEVKFGTIPTVGASVESIVLVQAKERERLQMMLHALGAAMSPAARLWLAGENRTGIKSSGKHLARYFEKVNKTDNARHCVLFEAEKAKPPGPFSLAAYEKHWFLPAPWNDIKIISLPGTFAHGRLDGGTRLLLEAIQELAPEGRILDFACGNGVVGMVLHSLQHECELTLLDTSALALESARRTLNENAGHASILSSDGLFGADERYDWIVSNPPFHRGITNDLEIARRFFHEASHHLQKTGKMLLVYNHHLPYQGWLKDNFICVDAIRTSREFRVVLASGVR